MKYILLISFLSIIVIFSCKKDPLPPIEIPPCVPIEEITSIDTNFYVGYKGKQDYGYATAIKLNKHWEASAKAFVYNNSLYIGFKTYRSMPDLPLRVDDDIEISELPFKLGCYRLNRELHDGNSKLVCSYLGRDSDVIEDYYHLISDHENYLQIDTLDLINNRVSGQFMMSFERDTSSIGKPWNPDFVRFFNGRFSCDIVE